MTTPAAIGSLFSGYGGLDAGVALALGGGRTAWVSDIDPGACRILAHRYPDVPNLGDISTVDWTTVEPVDVLTGGFPCQDVSHAGRRAGLTATTRTGLWAHMARAIDTLRPALVVAENVRGLLSATAASDVEPCPWCMGDEKASPMRALGAVLADLADIGYDAAWCGLPASGVGACHGRFRVFVVAWPADAQGDAWRVIDGDEGPPAADADRVGREWAGRARDGRPGPTDRSAPPDVTLLPTPAVNDMGAGKTVEAWDEWTARMKAAHGNGNGHGASLAVEALRLLPTPSVADSMGGHANRSGARSDELLLPGVATELGALLPTPRATDGTKGGPNQRGSSGDLMLPSAVLLPTPQAHDAVAGKTPDQVAAMRARGHGVANLNEVPPDAWGKYADAIARHAATTGRPAPSPTEQDWPRWEARKRKRLTSTLPVGMRGSIRFILDGPPRRLSPAFVEWMMMLPAGWVTDPAIWDGMTTSKGKPVTASAIRNHQLKALGNGVVPQQAAEAVRWLLAHITAERAA